MRTVFRNPFLKGTLNCVKKLTSLRCVYQATPFIAGLAVAATAMAGKYGIQAWHSFKSRPPRPISRKFYDGGFQPTMTRREAALILGVR